jgi:FtsZ-binding cell division protein ZapB
MAISREEIFAAADALVAAGERPTLEGIRKKTGGSYTTISPIPNEWKARQAVQGAPVREPIPQVVQDKLREVGGEIWRVASDLANTRLAAEREALEKVREEIEAERTEAVELADRLNGELEGLKAQVATLEASEAAAKDEADCLRGELSQVREEAAGLRGKLEASQEQIAVLLAKLTPTSEEPVHETKEKPARTKK